MQQVITIAANGIVSGLQRKPGQGLNLQKLGRAQTTRASEIVWDEDAQLWYVDVLQEAGKGVLTAHKFREAGCDYVQFACEFYTGSDFISKPLHFREYDEAVRAEIAFLDALRLKGQF